MKYQVRMYITGATLVKQFKIEAKCREDAIAEATNEARREWAAGDLDGWDGDLDGWDMTLDSEVDEDATEVVE